MAKYIIIKPFKDAATKEVYKTGAVVDFTKKRADEINDNLPGFIGETVDEAVGYAVEPTIEEFEEPTE